MPPSQPITPPALLQFTGAAVRLYDQIVFPNTNWTIREGDHWAIAGPNGSGKSVLAGAIMGKFPVVEGRMRLTLKDPITGEMSSSSFHLVGMVSFSTASILHRHPDMYYQQRFHSTETQGSIPVRDLITPHGQELPSGSPNPLKLAKELGIDNLLERGANQLSNGETKKLLILRALIRNPALLILDQPFTGLDPNSRGMVSALIDKITQRGVTVILITAGEELPHGVTHVLQIQDLQVKGVFARKDYKQPATEDWAVKQENELPNQISRHYQDIPFKEAVRMEDVNISYGQTRILKEVSWVVKKSERWALSGPNGSGKSTLLSLINADHPQAYALKIWLFDRVRGSGETIWQIKERIGYVSPELHAFIPGHLLCREVMQTANSQKWLLDSYLHILGISGLADRRFDQVSTGEQRLLLLAHALAKNPPLLILDEPCQGMDDLHRGKIKWLLDQVMARTSMTLIYVSHVTGDIPQCVNHILRLQAGTASSFVMDKDGMNNAVESITK